MRCTNRSISLSHCLGIANSICLPFRVNCLYSMMTITTSAQGVPQPPTQGLAPLFTPRRLFIHHGKWAHRARFIIPARHQKGSTGAQWCLSTASSQCVLWQPWETRVATRLSRTRCRWRTAETCSRNIHSTLPKTNLSHLRPWGQTGVHTCQVTATTGRRAGKLLRIVRWHKGT